jgi:hypothetical protein
MGPAQALTDVEGRMRMLPCYATSPRLPGPSAPPKNRAIKAEAEEQRPPQGEQLPCYIVQPVLLPDIRALAKTDRRKMHSTVEQKAGQRIDGKQALMESAGRDGATSIRAACIIPCPF